MFYPLLCGAFHHQEEENDDESIKSGSSPVRSPRKSKRKKGNKNPYSTRGLDQFSALLAELEEKKQKIYSQMGSQSMVRFVYNNSNDWVPVVVNLKDKKLQDNKTQPENNTQERNIVLPEAIIKPPSSSDSDNNTDTKTKKMMIKKKKKRFSWNNVVEFQNLMRKPCYYIPVITILILLFLVFFGRSVAILCTCIGWYAVPTIDGEASNLRTSMKKKDYVRRLSGNNLVTGKSPLHHRNVV